MFAWLQLLPVFILTGHFGVIRRAQIYLNTDRSEKTTAAVKLIKNQTTEDVKCFLREAYIMSQFDHVNVLNLMAIIWEQGEPPAVVTPYMGKGSLLDLIRKSDMVGGNYFDNMLRSDVPCLRMFGCQLCLNQ